MADHSHIPHPLGYDKKEISIGYIILWSVIAVIFMAVSIIVCDTYFVWVKEQQIRELSLSKPNPELIALHAKEDSLLTSYGHADTTNTHYRIPISDAKEQLLKERAALANPTSGGKK